MPLKSGYCYIFCNDGMMMAFNWLANCSDDVKKVIIDKINGESTHKFKHKFFLEEGKIFFVDENEKRRNLLLVRGWGHLIGVGGYNLSAEKAAEIQNEFANYVVEQLNK